MGLVINSMTTTTGTKTLHPLSLFNLAFTSASSSLEKVFTFSTAPPPFKPLSVPAPTTISKVRLKRARPITDVDGIPDSHPKKKRRLRLLLITSRLSRPYSSPPTHIVNRGSSKIAVWAKQKALGRNLLRKAAILNRVRRSALAVAEQQQKMERERLACLYQFGIGHELREAREERRVPRRDYTPLPPSPLGLSNYDALDLDDDFYDSDEHDYHHHDDGDARSDRSESDMVYSDFSILSSDGDEAVPDDEFTDAFCVMPSAIEQTRRPPSPDEKVVEMLKEKDRQREMMFLKFI